MKEAGPARRAALQEARDAAAADDVPMADVADADPDALMPDATGRLASSSMRTTHLSSRAHATQFSHMLDCLTMHSLPPAAARCRPTVRAQGRVAPVHGAMPAGRRPPSTAL